MFLKSRFSIFRMIEVVYNYFYPESKSWLIAMMWTATAFGILFSFVMTVTIGLATILEIPFPLIVEIWTLLVACLSIMLFFAGFALELLYGFILAVVKLFEFCRYKFTTPR